MRIGVDIDGTLTLETKGWDYENRTPYQPMMDAINKAHFDGHDIVLFTSRKQEDCQKTLAWLFDNKVHFSSIIFDKPKFDLYVGDEVMLINHFLRIVLDGEEDI